MKLPYRGSGKIHYLEYEYKCDLYFSEGQEDIILIIKENNIFAGFLKFPLEMHCIFGQIENGFLFTLLDLVRIRTVEDISKGTTEFIYNAGFILCGVGGKLYNEPIFKKVSYSISNVIEWGGQSVYSIGDNHELIAKQDSVILALYEDLEFHIDYYVTGSRLPLEKVELLQDSINLIQTGMIIIGCKKETKFCQFNEIMNKVKKIIELSLFRKVNFEKVTGFLNGLQDSVGENEIERHIEIYGKNIKATDSSKTNPKKHAKWINLSELISNNSFDLFFEKYTKMAPIIELYLEPIYVENSSTIKIFLNIVQALETYHSRFITNKLDCFKKRIEELVINLPDGEKQKCRSFLKAGSHNFITLESRLADLLFAKGDIIFDTGKIIFNDYPSVVAHSRNYYVHYDEDIKNNNRVLSEEELKFYNSTLIQILEYYILIELGFSNHNNEIKNKLRLKWGSITNGLDILDKSRSMNTSK